MNKTELIAEVAKKCGLSKKDAEKGTICLATKSAVTLFNKKGTEVEQVRDADHRKNDIFSRKYYIAALTDAGKAVKIVKGSAKASADTTVSTGKTYYAQTDNGYVVVAPAEGANPKTEGWFEIA